MFSLSHFVWYLKSQQKNIILMHHQLMLYLKATNGHAQKWLFFNNNKFLKTKYQLLKRCIHKNQMKFITRLRSQTQNYIIYDLILYCYFFFWGPPRWGPIRQIDMSIVPFLQLSVNFPIVFHCHHPVNSRVSNRSTSTSFEGGQQRVLLL